MGTKEAAELRVSTTTVDQSRIVTEDDPGEVEVLIDEPRLWKVWNHIRLIKLQQPE